ncbi:UTP--glucose-1-phosphate uridylyltransferase GalU [Alicyclobacillus fructus]|uniref:UTP--glucose-1-phosphate uridylyltransferase GalU n=1 Tax=Alicyclobacillus fructus TaxID=2816082 RepID=UPI001A8FAA8B|nr:UTP--glucose-1-phosphate uridylyltransferase GalU [Alicyclobacillus fructus]
MIRKAVIPAAGLGTRLLPATKVIPKEMVPIVDKPTIQYIVEEAVASGIEEIIIVTSRSKRAIEDHFDASVELEDVLERKGSLAQLDQIRSISRMAHFHYVRQARPLGLGHAVLCARRLVGDEPFAVLLGDDVFVGKTPCLQQLIQVHEETGRSVVAVQEVEETEVSRYGVIRPLPIRERLWDVESLVEKPQVAEAPSNLAVAGRYVLTPDVFDILECVGPGRGGEIQLTDALSLLCQRSGLVALEFEGKRYDVGDKRGYVRATLEFALQDEVVRSDIFAFLERYYAREGTA